MKEPDSEGANDEARRAVARRKQAEEEARAKAAKRRHLQSNPPKAQAKSASKLGFRPLAVIALNTAVRGRKASEKAALPLDDLCQSFFAKCLGKRRWRKPRTPQPNQRMRKNLQTSLGARPLRAMAARPPRRKKRVRSGRGKS